MSLKKWKPYFLLVSFCLFGWLLLKETLPCSAAVIISYYLYRRTKSRRPVLLFLLICLIFCIPAYTAAGAKMDQGQAVIVSGRYAVLQKGRTRVLVYTQEPLELDGIYAIDGEIKEPVYEKTTFGFQTEKWMKQIGVCGIADVNDVHLLRSVNTPRHLLQKRIEGNGRNQALLYKVLLNIKLNDDNDTFLFTNGFSLAGILAFLDFLLKRHLYPESRKKILFICSILLCLFYRFPIVLTQSLIFRILSFTDEKSSVKTGAGLLCTMCLYPDSVLTASFLIPAVYRLSFLWKEERKNGCFWMVLCIQSILFHEMNPLQSLLYPFVKGILGCIWILCLTAALFSVPLITLDWIEKMLDMVDSMVLPGSMMGIGLVFYLLILYSLRKKKHFFRHALCWLLVFQTGGFFHPLAEISFINVGQGDAILIRMPLNRQNVLIDTGKPSQWKNLQAYLDGGGIRKINTLIITHGDEDHSGNQENVISKYHPDQIVTGHHEEICSGQLSFYDLNAIKNEDENESSLVEYVSLNGMKILLTGDIDAYAERQIAMKYPQLECDILKLSHHGSKTASTDDFLDAIKPRIGIVSAGSYSMYHHPSPEVIQRLLKRHIPYLNTREEGDIRIVCLPHLNILLTSSGKIGIIGR